MLDKTMSVHIDPFVARPSQYSLWPLSEMEGKDGMYVYRQNSRQGKYQNYFKSIVSDIPVTVYRNGFAFKTFHIIHGKNFHVYEQFKEKMFLRSKH